VNPPILRMDSRERVFPTSITGIPNTVYTRPIGNWTQFWMFYELDWSPLPWRRGHKCDWELVQVHADGRCVYGQHKGGEPRPAPAVRWNGERPVVFVARGKHACYYTPGRHRTGMVDWDFADGYGRRILPNLEPCPLDGWRHASFGAVHAPGRTRRWIDPDGWAL
jgi:hypothetical protein